jgi:hypothetical protein
MDGLKQPADRRGVIAKAKLYTDHLGHALSGPERSSEAIGFGTTAQWGSGSGRRANGSGAQPGGAHLEVRDGVRSVGHLWARFSRWLTAALHHKPR